MKQALSWNELLDSLSDKSVKPDENGWNIYRYLSANIEKKDSTAKEGKESENADETLSSEEARMLLLAYMKLPLERPTLLHSMMLSVALKMVDVYTDFKLPKFLKLWNISNLRREDYERGKSDNGKSFHSLVERLAKAVARYRLTHPNEPFDENTLRTLGKEAAALGFQAIMPMVAVKVFETTTNGKKTRFVKLIGPKGEELTADWHIFRAKPWGIAGKMYDVLPRRSAETGKLRVDSVVLSTKKAEDVFGQRIGYVDRYDEEHEHFHIFDSDSRHFVAESPKLQPFVGSYVWFAPIIPAEDKFKSAIVLRTENAEEARQIFGLTPARVTSVDKGQGYFRFETTDGKTGLGHLLLSPRELKVGDEVRLILFLKRYSRNAEKQLHVAEIV